MITIIDYGTGNLRSIANMLRKLGAPSVISGDKEVIMNATRIILPGVGAFDTAVKELKKLDLIPVLQEKVIGQGIPVLGICLGMQLLTNGSEEGNEKGLGWIPGFARRFPVTEGLKVPHMRWNTVKVTGESPLVNELDEEARFYFVHSYYVKAEHTSHCILSTDHGVSFDSGLQKNRIMGVQFHPERSHKFGLKLLYNFISC